MKVTAELIHHTRSVRCSCSRSGPTSVRQKKNKRKVNKEGFNLEEGEPEQQSFRFFSFGFISKQKTRRCEKTENWDDYLRLECKGSTTVEGRTDGRTSCLSLQEDAHPRASSGGERFSNQVPQALGSPPRQKRFLQLLLKDPSAIRSVE